MTPFRTPRLRRFLPRLLLAAALAVGLAGTALSADPPGWTVEPDVDPPSYATVQPLATALNIDSVVLACEAMAGVRVLQLQLYLTDDGPLRPIDPMRRLEDDPRAVLVIDGATFPASLLFSEDHVVVADSREGFVPRLSEALLDALQAGSRMTLRVPLLDGRTGTRRASDGDTVVDLQAGGGHDAVAALRRCTRPGSDRREPTPVASL
ncbi:hypothetical protein [Reyranella sp.]|uniref:hypothetical protein n=1 Tax=Reyranella sp. TaxID=1929291 RepID=UPI003BAC914A